jgi:hypothetical protein
VVLDLSPSQGVPKCSQDAIHKKFVARENSLEMCKAVVGRHLLIEILKALRHITKTWLNAHGVDCCWELQNRMFLADS